MPGNPDVVQIKLDKRVLPENVLDDLAFVRVEQSVTLPDRFEIQIYDPLFVHFDQDLFKVGADVEVAFRGGGKLVTVTKGYVTSVLAEAGNDTVDRMVVSGFDASFKLTLEPRSRTFLKQSASDIASKIAGEHGLSAKVQSTPFKFEHVLQYNETDYEFLQRMADQVGFRAWVIEDDLYFRAMPEGKVTTQLDMGDDLIKLSLRMSAADRADSADVSFWDVKQKQVITSSVKSPGKATYVNGALTKSVEDGAVGAFKKTALRTGHVPVESNDQAKALAEGRIRTASASQVVLKGEAIGSPQIVAGSKVKITGAGRTASGEYLLTSVEHVYGGGTPYKTRFTSGEREPSGLVDLLGGAHQPRGNGYSPWGQVSSAIVTNLNDPEKLGRIKVKFGTMEKEEESDWARLLAPGAGIESGLQIMPEVGDEVLVGFEYGDPRRPIVMGGLWNGKDKPPEDVDAFFKSGKVVKRTWRSRTGHAIELHDGSGDPDQKIVISHGKSKATLTFTDKGIELKTTGSDDKVSVDSAGDVEIKSKKDVSVKGQKVTVEGSAGLELKGAKIDIKASGNVTIKGAVIQLN